MDILLDITKDKRMETMDELLKSVGHGDEDETPDVGVNPADGPDGTSIGDDYDDDLDDDGVFADDGDDDEDDEDEFDEEDDPDDDE